MSEVERRVSFVSEVSSRVDKASLEVPRSVFSLDSVEIIVNGKSAKKSAKVNPGDVVEVSWTEEVQGDVVPEDIPLDVLYEDDSVLVIDKPSGMVVHPGAGNWSGTLVNALLFRYGPAFDTSEEFGEEGWEADDVPRPGIVHRLDKDTSGVMVVAKTSQAHRALAKQFASHTTEKRYIALCKGVFAKKRGAVDLNIMRDPRDRKAFTVTTDRTKGKDALTHWTVLRQGKSHALVSVRIETGRTHQIRVHMKSVGHPVVGDPIYSRPDPACPGSRLMLHALELSFDHPVTGVRMTFRARMPEAFRSTVLQVLA